MKETADVSAVISKVSNLLFILLFSILRCNIAAIAQNIRFLWCINNSVIAQNICLCLCPILCPIEGKWKKVLMYLISSPTCLHSPASRLHKGNAGLQVKKKYSSMYSIEKVLHQKGTQKCQHGGSKSVNQQIYQKGTQNTLTWRLINCQLANLSKRY